MYLVVGKGAQMARKLHVIIRKSRQPLEMCAPLLSCGICRIKVSRVRLGVAERCTLN
jgi:hypothetical protein